ncbi:pseudouridine synthase [Dinghuibacter silviterrae]|uniref:Pseudouridine synthase n=1 Tax=Dinghuibacter silviterrae TaxID=1539049 RepID=A0A4R8DNM7_9BACT|nr:pseudouridine synthase [Dinghuibacter silviterrae]TDW99307.1 23S rRNA pseudouridine2605 synthase [Dinghuibacter silviterrae]
MAKKPFDKFMNTRSNAAKKEGFRQAKREIKKEIAEGMARTKARKAEEAAQAKAIRAAGGVPTRNAHGARKTDAPAPHKPAHKAPRPETPQSKAAPKAPPHTDNPRPASPRPPAAPTEDRKFFVPAKPRKADSPEPRPIAPSAKVAARTRPVAPPKPRPARPETGEARPAAARPAPGSPAKAAPKAPSGPQMPLNKYIAHSGICSRREAADMVKEGVVKVNGKVITEPGHKIEKGDEVKVNGKKIVPTGNLVYILLNKPKDYITTSNDPEGRKTVIDLVRKATDERVYPVGRLDRNTTGVLLLTNDGELAQKLAHPAYEVKKVYEVRLDKELTKKDFDHIMAGVTLEDGPITPDALAYADSKDKSVIGIEIHSGKNRIVRRLFEHMGYTVKNLDRVMYAGLTKKNVDRGRWRFLAEKEVRLLKFLNTSFTRKKV